MKEKRYQELTLPEKLIVGLIYDLYMEWISKRLGHKYLKNSLFSDFKFAHHISRTPFAEYADYFYMWGYEEELKAKFVRLVSYPSATKSKCGAFNLYMNGYPFPL